MHAPACPPARPSSLFSRTGVRYEVALDVLGAMIAHYAEAVARERDKRDANGVVIAVLRHRQAGFRDLRADLDPRHDAAIEAVLRQVGPSARVAFAPAAAAGRGARAIATLNASTSYPGASNASSIRCWKRCWHRPIAK